MGEGATSRSVRQKQTWPSWAYVVAAWCTTSAAAAADLPADDGQASGNVPEASSTGDTKRAQQLVNEADRLFRAGDAAGSIPLLEAAYRIGGWPGCLLNLAMAHHAVSNCEIARGYYQLYLNVDPYTERRGEVTDALGELQASCGLGWAPEPERPPSSSPPPVSETKTMEAPSWPAAPQAASAARRPPDLVEWSLIGAGAAAGVGAFVFLLGSQRKNAEAAEFGDYSEGDLRAREIHDTGVLYNRLSLGFGIGAAALMGTGAALWLLGTPTGSSVGIATEGFPAVRYQGRF